MEENDADMSMQMLLSNVLIRITVLETLLKQKGVITSEELEKEVGAMTELLVKAVEDNIIKNTPET